MATPKGIVLILADDMGYSDVGCYGGEIKTPNLDRLGRGGARFTQFYNTARCSPSRASLLTGLHPHQTGIGVLTRPDLPDGYPGTLNPSCETIAETLQAQGWQTWLSGKWHLAADNTHPNGSWPTRKGFGRFFGTLAGCSSYFDPQTLTDGESPCSDAQVTDTFYYTDAISDHAVKWIGRHDLESADQPFFLYLAYTAPHWPLHARAEDLRAQQGRFDIGWDQLRAERLDRLIGEGILAPGTGLSERDSQQPAWTDAVDREWEVSRMEAYAAQIIALDRGVGRVLQALEDTGRLENTLVLFLSDNGGSAEELPIGDRFTDKDRVLQEGRTRQGEPIRWGNEPGIVPGSENTYASYGVPWANLSNTPFRHYKRWVHEGGIATPLIVHWPAGGVAPQIVDQPAQLVDLVPTIRDAVGLPQSNAAEGRSLLGLLRGDHLEPVPLFWEHIGNAAIRFGRWKLVRDHPEGWELYDLEADRTESNDLAAMRPTVVARLAGLWQDWADRVGVIDWDQMVGRYRAEGLAPSDAEE
jgi:arylsulfatase